jgi:hypothetical protein
MLPPSLGACALPGRAGAPPDQGSGELRLAGLVLSQLVLQDEDGLRRH